MDGFGFSIAGLLVGIAVGATGVGGGSLMTPILILFYGITPTVAVGTDLLYASISKTFGVFLHRRNDSVDWPIVGWQALGSVPAALLTLWWISRIGPSESLNQLIRLTLSVAIITTASFTLFQDAIARSLHLGRDGNGFSPTMRRILTVAAGALIGTVVTISSVGAGVIGMMLLMLLYPKVAPIRLVGSDLAHAVLITAIAGAGHARLGAVHFSMLGFLLAGALPGIYVGTRIGFRLDGRVLKRVIAGLLIVVGAMSLAKALPASGPVADKHDAGVR